MERRSTRAARPSECGSSSSAERGLRSLALLLTDGGACGLARRDGAVGPPTPASRLGRLSAPRFTFLLIGLSSGPHEPLGPPGGGGPGRRADAGLGDAGSAHPWVLGAAFGRRPGNSSGRRWPPPRRHTGIGEQQGAALRCTGWHRRPTLLAALVFVLRACSRREAGRRCRDAGRGGLFWHFLDWPWMIACSRWVFTSRDRDPGELVVGRRAGDSWTAAELGLRRLPFGPRPVGTRSSSGPGPWSKRGAESSACKPCSGNRAAAGCKLDFVLGLALPPSNVVVILVEGPGPGAHGP